MDLYGRTVITTDYTEITADNIVDILDDAEETHSENIDQMDTLWDYYTGLMDIQNREKSVRTDINNIVTVNIAKEVVDFKVGYRCGGPVVYVSRNGEDGSEEVAKLNDYMLSEGKPSKDKQLYFYQSVFGTGYKMALPDSDLDDVEALTFESDEAPFEAYTLDPRKAFVIYSSGIGNKPMCGVYRVTDEDDTAHYTAYTETEYFKVVDGEIIERGTNGIGRIPIVEYPNNEARIGDFEPVVSLIDSVNKLESNRMDGVEQFIQSLIILTNCDLPEGTTATELMESGLIKLRTNGDLEANVKILSEQLDQTQTQKLKDDLYQSILTICAMPNRNGGSSTSDTGVAVIYRDGWNAAEASAQASELIFKQSEIEFLKIVLSICSDLNALKLSPSLVDVKFSRRNYENIETKSQVLISMLNNEKIDPKLAFIYSGMFSDPEEAYRTSMAWFKSNSTDTSSDNSGENQSNATSERTDNNAQV